MNLWARLFDQNALAFQRQIGFEARARASGEAAGAKGAKLSANFNSTSGVGGRASEREADYSQWKSRAARQDTALARTRALPSSTDHCLESQITKPRCHTPAANPIPALFNAAAHHPVKSASDQTAYLLAS
jgi:hypothetical protein